MFRRWILSILRWLADLRPIRRLYEEILLNQISNGPMPSHIAFILDGNRRWAREKGLPVALGHDQGAKKLGEVLSWLYDLKIKTTTVYALSIENLSRPIEEVNSIIEILQRYLKEALEKKIFEKNRVRVKVIGKLDFLPEAIRDLIGKIESNTRYNHDHYFNIAVGYGGRQEIVEAIRRLALLIQSGEMDPSEINEGTVAQFLYTSHLPNPEPDIVIRTSGEFRISNFLLWQIAYSEFLILDVYWPQFRKIDLLRAIRAYQQRKRRFGR